MKAQKTENNREKDHQNRRNSRHSNRRPQAKDQDRINEMLKFCLQKILELQQEIETEDNRPDPEAEGYTACAMETLRFLSSQGLPPNHPMIRALSDRLLRKRD